MAGKSSVMAIGIIVIVIAAIAAAVLLTGGGVPKSTTSSSTVQGTTTPPSAGQGQLSMQMTDPPTVPNGTSALVVQYSSIAAHTTGGGWVTANVSGSVDLMALVNVSQVVGSIKLANGTAVDQLRLYVNSTKITINGTAYNVTVPSGEITAQLRQSTRVNGTSAVLVDLSPTVVVIYTNTTPVFVLVPSVRAVFIGRTTNTQMGAMASLNGSERADLEAATANIAITNASLMESNGITTLSVTVKDNSNTTATIMHVGVRGQENITVNVSVAGRIANAILNRTLVILNRIQNETEHENASASANAMGSGGENGNGINGTIGVNVNVNGSSGSDRARSHTGFNMTAAEDDGLEIGGITGSANISAFVHAAILNGTVNTTAFRTALIQKVREALTAHLNNSEMFQDNFRTILFQVGTNGTLALPFSEDEFSGPLGFNISAGQSYTFRFTGAISLAGNRLQISVIPGNVYTVGVQGQEGARATMNATATG